MGGLPGAEAAVLYIPYTLREGSTHEGAHLLQSELGEKSGQGFCPFSQDFWKSRQSDAEM
jgi:hypothetical protein